MNPRSSVRPDFAPSVTNQRPAELGWLWIMTTDVVTGISLAGNVFVACFASDATWRLGYLEITQTLS